MKSNNWRLELVTTTTTIVVASYINKPPVSFGSFIASLWFCFCCLCCISGNTSNTLDINTVVVQPLPPFRLLHQSAQSQHICFRVSKISSSLFRKHTTSNHIAFFVRLAISHTQSSKHVFKCLEAKPSRLCSST